MNIRRYLFAVVALYFFIFTYESCVHGYLLTNLYMQTPELWRSYEQMQSLIPFNIFLMVLFSFSIAFIFTRFYPNGGWKNGLKFGFYVGTLSAIQAGGAYFYLPISLTLAGVWFAVYLLENIIGGVIVGAIYASTPK